MKGHRDLRLVVALALLSAVMAPLLPVEVLSLLFLLPLAFFLPGYALTVAAFARRPIGWPQLLLLSLGLSLSVLVLGALVLNYVPGGVGPVSWALLLALVVLYGCRAAAVRRPKAPARAGRAWPRPHLSAAAAGLLLGALLSAAAALALSFTTTSAKNADGYTEMWLLPPAPRDAAAGGARVGVTSQEQRPTAYRLRIRVGGRPGALVRTFSLDPGETRVIKLGAEAPLRPEGTVPVSAALFVRSKPSNVYRRVSGWLANPEASQ
jgi:uncharacterized membrane protein